MQAASGIPDTKGAGGFDGLGQTAKLAGGLVDQDGCAEGLKAGTPSFEQCLSAEMSRPTIQRAEQQFQQINTVEGTTQRGFDADGGGGEVSSGEIDADVDANAQDDSDEAAAVPGGFREDAADFASIQQDIVGPFDGDGLRSKLIKHLGDGDRAEHGDLMEGGGGWMQQEGEDQGCAGRGEPGSTQAAAALHLLVGDDDRAARPTLLQPVAGEVIGAADRLDETDWAG